MFHRFLSVVVFSLMLISCNRSDETQASGLKQLDTIISIDRLESDSSFKTISSVFNDTNYVHWAGLSKEKDALVSDIYLRFRHDTLIYFYHGQCQYFYPVQLTKNKIVMFWAMNPDCLLDLYLDGKFGLKNYPEIGKRFADYELINDTTLKATYYYPEWVSKFNDKWKEMDTIFPVLLRVNKQN